MLPSLDCGTPAPCCDGFFNIAEDLRVFVTTRLAECFTDPCVGELRSYVTMGRPSDLMSNYLAVCWMGITVENTQQARSVPMAPMAQRMTLAVRLVESGWPTAATGDRQIELPSETALHQAAIHALGHAERMVRAVASWCAQKGCDGRRYVGTTPLPPSGGSVGVEAVVTVEAFL